MSVEASDSSRLINVKVLSQLPEPDGLIHFENLPITTTVGELKVKVRDHVASKPAVENQRFIYRGRLMARENDTMMDVFGRDAIHSSDTHNLHLVIRVGNLPTPFAASVHNPTNGVEGGHVPQVQAGLAQSPGQIQQQVQPGQVQPPPQPHIFPNTAHPHLHLGQGPFPIPSAVFPGIGEPQPTVTLQQGPFVPPFTQAFAPGLPHPPPFMPPPIPDFGNLLQQHMAALQRYHNPQTQISGAPVPLQGPESPQSPQPPQPPQSGQLPIPLQSMQNIQQQIAQFQQQHNPAHTSPNTPLNTSASAEQTPQGQPQPALDMQGPPGMPFGPQGFTRQCIGPNGERMSVSIQATSRPMPFAPFQNGFTNLHPQRPAMVVHNGNGPHPNVMHSLASSSQVDAPRNGSFLGQYEHMNFITTMRRYHEALVELGHRAEQQRTYSTDSQPIVADGMRAQLFNIIRGRNLGQQRINDFLVQSGTSFSEPLSSTDVATLQSLNDRFQEQSIEVMHSIERIRVGSNALGSSTVDALAGSVHDGIVENSQQPITPAVADNASINNVTAYVLTSPMGPHAIVFTPQGPFSSSVSTSPALSRAPSRSWSRHPSGLSTRTHRNRRSLAALRGNLPATPVEPAPVAENQAADRPAITDLVQIPRRDEAQAAPVAPADIRPLEANNEDDAFGIPGRLFRHAWLFIRLFGFIWFFTGGLGSNRTLMIAGAAIIWFAIQAGLLGDRVDRVRRHLEGLLGPPNGPPAVQRIQVEVAGLPEGQPQERNGVEPVDPEETAARLLRERAERDRGWVRQRLRTVEGAVALFIASLYPGVGERHVAAREEQRRQAEARAAELLRAMTEEAQESNQQDGNDQDTNHGNETEEVVEPKIGSSEAARIEGSIGSGSIDTTEGGSTPPKGPRDQ